MGDTDNAAQASSADGEQQAAAAPVAEPEPEQPVSTSGDADEIKPATTYEI